jgi:hypothetical protein
MKKPFPKLFCLGIVQDDFGSVHRSKDDSFLGVAGGIQHRLTNRRKRTSRDTATPNSRPVYMLLRSFNINPVIDARPR